MKAENERRSALLAQARGQYKQCRGEQSWSIASVIGRRVLTESYLIYPIFLRPTRFEFAADSSTWCNWSLGPTFTMDEDDIPYVDHSSTWDILMALQNTHWDRTFVGYHWYPRWWENGTTHYHLWVPRCGEVNLNQVKVQSPYMIILTLKNST